MEKKIVFFELPVDTLEKIDRFNTMETRSVFISELLETQLQSFMSEMDVSTDMSSKMEVKEPDINTGIISLVDNRGCKLGTFDINSVEGFDSLTKKIIEISNDPIVRMKSRRVR